MNLTVQIPPDFLDKVDKHAKNEDGSLDTKKLQQMQVKVIDWLHSHKKDHPNFFPACKQLAYLTVLIIRTTEDIKSEAARTTSLNDDPLVKQVQEKLILDTT